MPTFNRRLLKSVVYGTPVADKDASHTLLPKHLALPVFSSDAMSSTAYATEEIIIKLGAAGFVLGSSLLSLQGYLIPISVCIGLLLLIVATSYSQTIKAYPKGGGAYRVAKEAFGETAAQTAGAALATDYILTVAVSSSAATAALVSLDPRLDPFRVAITVVMIWFIAVLNLRGAKESGKIFAVPTYFFLLAMLTTLGIGLFKMVTGQLSPVTGIEPLHYEHHVEAVGPALVFLLLTAFSSGCSALTGVEAIANGTTAFKEPQTKNAVKTLWIMVLLLITMFAGMTVLSIHVHAVPSHIYTIVAQIGQQVWGKEGFGLMALLGGTALILSMASNTAFADFPRLANLHASDNFQPRRFTEKGPKLAFDSGILVLAFLASILVVITGAIVTKLIPMYMVGVFLAFTISQFGMAKRIWISGHIQPGNYVQGIESKIEYNPGWKSNFAISVIGGTVTAIVMMIAGITKFSEGSWIIIVAIPLLVVVFFQINKHYSEVAAKLSINGHIPNFGTKVTPINNTDYEVAVFFCDTWSQLSVKTMIAAIKSGLPLMIVHVDVNKARAEAFKVKMDAILKENGWTEDVVLILEEPYRDLRSRVENYLSQLQKALPSGANIHVYAGELKVIFPYTLLHNGTHSVLRAAEDVLDKVEVHIIPMDLAHTALPDGYHWHVEHHPMTVHHSGD